MSTVVPVELESNRKLDPGWNQVPPNGPSLHRRFVQSFQGDPVSPGQQITPNVVKTLTVPNLAVSAVMTVEVGSLRITFDGTIPTATAGLLYQAGTVLTITGKASMQGAQFIAAVGATVVDVQYFT